MKSEELKQWLRDNSSGIYRPSAAAADYIDELEALLLRYRNETPLGHQPHMIAHKVDELLELDQSPKITIPS